MIRTSALGLRWHKKAAVRVNKLCAGGCGKVLKIRPCVARKGFNHYCQDPCRGNVAWTKTIEPRTCEQCGTTFLPKEAARVRRFCSGPCYGEWRHADAVRKRDDAALLELRALAGDK